LLTRPIYADQAELTDILAQLGQIQTTLAQTLQQVAREIARVETLLCDLSVNTPETARPLIPNPSSSGKSRSLMRG
jgi:hypothetical protein